MPVKFDDWGLQVAFDGLVVFSGGAANSHQARVAGPGAVLVKAGLVSLAAVLGVEAAVSCKHRTGDRGIGILLRIIGGLPQRCTPQMLFRFEEFKLSASFIVRHFQPKSTSNEEILTLRSRTVCFLALTGLFLFPVRPHAAGSSQTYRNNEAGCQSGH